MSLIELTDLFDNQSQISADVYLWSIAVSGVILSENVEISLQLVDNVALQVSPYKVSRLNTD